MTGNIETCTSCEQKAVVHVQWPVGPTCQACYRRTLRSLRPCAKCGTDAVLIARNDRGAMTCGPCAGSKFDYTCSTCSETGEQHLAGLCMRCSAKQIITEALTRGYSPLPGALAQIPTALALRGDARSTVRWLAKARTRTMLTSIAARVGAGTLTHADLDSCELYARHHLRATLVDLGLLPERDEPLERLETWVSDFTSGLPDENAHLIDTYARWSVLRTARRRQQRYGTFTLGADASARERIRSANRLLTHLTVTGRSISDLDQATFDRWCNGNIHRTRVLAGFIKWLTARHLVTDVTVPTIPKAPIQHLGEEDEQRELIRSLLDDTSELELDLRVAGLLILLYGARIPQITGLTTDHINVDGNRVAVTLPQAQRLSLPPAMAPLVAELAANARTEQGRIRGTSTNYYLYPGGRRGEPLHTTTLGLKLKAAGISPRIHRNQAMLTLAEDLPAAVIAAHFGITIGAATTWSGISQRNQTDYIIARMPNKKSRQDVAANRREAGSTDVTA